MVFCGTRPLQSTVMDFGTVNEGLRNWALKKRLERVLFCIIKWKEIKAVLRWRVGEWIWDRNRLGNRGEKDGREFPEGGDICIPMADLCWGLPENNKIL